MLDTALLGSKQGTFTLPGTSATDKIKSSVGRNQKGFCFYGKPQTCGHKCLVCSVKLKVHLFDFLRHRLRLCSSILVRTMTRRSQDKPRRIDSIASLELRKERFAAGEHSRFQFYPERALFWDPDRSCHCAAEPQRTRGLTPNNRAVPAPSLSYCSRLSRSSHRIHSVGTKLNAASVRPQHRATEHGQRSTRR